MLVYFNRALSIHLFVKLMDAYFIAQIPNLLVSLNVALSIHLFAKLRVLLVDDFNEALSIHLVVKLRILYYTIF